MSAPPRWGPALPSVLSALASRARPGNPGAQPVGAARVSPTSAILRLYRASLKPGPKGRRLNSGPPNDPGPAKTYCYSPIRNPARVRLGPGGAFLSNSQAQSGSRRPRPSPRWRPAPTLGLRDTSPPPQEPGPTSPEWGAAQPSLHTQAHSHTKIIFLHAGESSGSH